MNNTDSSKYLSLKTAAKLYGYTRDHLGLMIRKGKLGGVKLGSYYVTTNDWMTEFVKNFSDPNHPTSKNKMSNKLLTGILTNERNVNADFALKKNISKYVDKEANKDRNLKLPPKTDHIISFEKKISEELSRLSSSSKYPEQTKNKIYMDSDKKDNDPEDYGFKMNFMNPYVVLPIREMKIEEREDILNRIGNNEEKKV